MTTIIVDGRARCGECYLPTHLPPDSLCSGVEHVVRNRELPKVAS